MDQRLHNLILAYQRAVRWAVSELERGGIPRPTSCDEWAGADIPGRGELRLGVRYFKHGYGVTVGSSSVVVDFDFGQSGQIDGFDAWRLWRFAEDNSDKFGFVEQEELKQAFHAAVAAGELEFSGYLLYYLSSS